MRVNSHSVKMAVIYGTSTLISLGVFSGVMSILFVY